MRHINPIDDGREVRVSENHLLCPITQEVMIDPVIAKDGVTYERETITKWLELRGTSPISREPMVSEFVPNRLVKGLIDEYNATFAPQEGVENREDVPVIARPIAYSELLKQLEERLAVPKKEIRYGSVVEQTLVALSGIYTDQKGASFDKDEDNVRAWNLCFCLNFASSAEHQVFTLYYRQAYPGAILNFGMFENKSAKIIFDVKLFSEAIVPALGEYRKDSHNLLMQELCNKLNVDYSEVYTGDVVERRMVSQAGIFTSQKDAYYRRNEDYSTAFYLAFTGNMECQKFVDYYQQNYPNFILRQPNYRQGELCKIDANSKLLLSHIAPTLGADIEQPYQPCTLI